jgi:hypothetical protein
MLYRAVAGSLRIQGWKGFHGANKTNKLSGKVLISEFELLSLVAHCSLE